MTTWQIDYDAIPHPLNPKFRVHRAFVRRWGEPDWVFSCSGEDHEEARMCARAWALREGGRVVE